MNDTGSRAFNLQDLARMHPPSGIVLVGAGDGSGEWSDFLLRKSNAACLLVEAEPAKYDMLRAVSAGHPRARVLLELASKETGEVHFHKTSISSENSLVAPATLRSLWPNVHILDVEKRLGTPLDQIPRNNLPTIDWLLVDCLPALPVIEGFGDNLDSIRILVARATLPENETEAPLTSVDYLQRFLEERGFLLHAIWDSRNPKVCHACFLRPETTRQPAANGTETEDLVAQNIAPSDASPKSQQWMANTPVAKKALHVPSVTYYQKFGKTYAKDSAPPFVLVDSKSLPRSGLHYLKDTFAKLLGEQFSFCEWYQEIGCCKKFPCSLQAYPEYARKTGQFRLRLTKSHDLNHSDPPLPTSRVLRRVVLIRDPLFILTSWFELDQLAKYRSVLLQQGIDIRKIWLLHEKELQLPAYDILGRMFVPPSDAEFQSWLGEKAQYINRFLMDWVVPSLSSNDPFRMVVHYEDIDSYVAGLLSGYRTWLSDASIRALDQFPTRGKGGFIKRADPYSLHVDSLETYIRDRKCLFEETIGRIISIPKKPNGLN
jgi:hypothetical protein